MFNFLFSILYEMLYLYSIDVVFYDAFSDIHMIYNVIFYDCFSWCYMFLCDVHVLFYIHMIYM